MCPHLSLNSSNDSSWCSARRRDEVLKLGRAATRGRAAVVRRVVARKKVEAVGPRAAIRRKDMVFFFSLVLLLCTGPQARSMGGSDKWERKI